MISTTSEYALRALSYLASRDGNSVLGRDLARETNVPANYLSKILLSLRRAGLVSTVRGTGGGYRLQRAASRIRLSQIVDLFDGAASREGCVLRRNNRCDDDHCCSAHREWHDVRAAYNHFLTATTLADISRSSDSKQH